MLGGGGYLLSLLSSYLHRVFGGDHHGGMLGGGGMKQMMLSFKQFLGMQDDSIDDKEAIQKYNEYKIEFRRKQISEFFEIHKEEDWWVMINLDPGLLGLYNIYLSTQTTVNISMVGCCALNIIIIALTLHVQKHPYYVLSG